MAFDVNTITLQGAIAVASATTGNKLVIDGCDATTDVLTQAQAAQIVNRPATPGSTTSEIALAGSTDNHVFAYAEFLQGQSTGGDFNSFFLYGHMEDDTSTVFVISVCSSTAPVHVPASGDVTNRTEVQFDLTFTPNAEVVKVADTSMYCTRGEFLILKERAVTTHAEGTPTTGEAQDIYGDKTFKNNIISNHIEPTTDDIGVVGTSSKRYSNGYFKEFHATTLVPGTIKASGAAEGYEASVTIYNTYFADLQHHCTLGTALYWIAGVYSTGIHTNGISALSGSDISVYSSNIIPGQHSGVTDSVNLGSATRTFQNIYVSSTYTNAISPTTSGGDVSFSGSKLVKGDSTSNAYVKFDSTADAACIQITTKQNANATEHGWTFSDATLYPDVENGSSLGTSSHVINKIYADWVFASVGSYSHPVGDVYANNFHGVLPLTNSISHETEVGGILVVKIYATSSGATLQAGDEIKKGTGNVSDIWLSSIDGSKVLDVIDPSHKFSMLSYADISASGNMVALVMRIQ